jgi:hypothetical protein
MEIITRPSNGGPLDMDVLREQAADRQLAPALEQPRDDQGRFRPYHPVPTHITDERP